MNDFSGIKSSISAWVIGENNTNTKLSIYEVYWGFYGEGNYCCYYCKMKKRNLVCITIIFTTACAITACK